LKKRRAEPRRLPSFPFYPRCSSPVGGAQLLKTRLLHTLRRSIRSPEFTPQPLAPVPGGGRKRPAPDRWFEPPSPSGKRRTDAETRSSPSMQAPCPRQALGI